MAQEDSHNQMALERHRNTDQANPNQSHRTSTEIEIILDFSSSELVALGSPLGPALVSRGWDE